jgi:hypothetical protein
MGRLGTAEEVADVITFIASPRAHWINGRSIAVDGSEADDFSGQGRMELSCFELGWVLGSWEGGGRD